MGVKNLWLGSDGGYVIVRDDGEYQWHGVPDGLAISLNKSRSPPAHVSFIGDDYHVLFEDDSSDYSISNNELWRGLEGYENGRRVRVIFRDNPHSYFVFGGGSATRDNCWWNGISVNLHNLLNGRQRSLPWVQDLQLGPNDTYFVKFQNGDWRSSVQDDLSYDIREADGEGKGIEMVRMSPDDPSFYWLLDSDGASTWRGSDRFGLMVKGAKWLDIGNLRYTHDSISPYFTDGRPVQDLVDGLRSGQVNVEEVEPVEAYPDSNGLWWCVSNRRLWAFKEAGVKYVPVIKIAERRSYPVYDNGKWIKVRGGGGSSEERRWSTEGSHPFDDLYRMILLNLVGNSNYH